VRNKIEHLRDHLFETLEKLRDEENPMDIARALAVSTVASAIIESAKIEYRYAELGRTLKSNFISIEDTPDPYLDEKRTASIADMREKQNGKGKSA
jgi:hypothetical protein